MPSSRPWFASLVVAVAALAANASAAVDVVVPNGVQISAALADGADVHRFGVSCPAGAKLAVSAKRVNGGPALTVRVVSPYGSEVASASGPKVTLKNVGASASGTYSVEVTSADATASGGYTLAVSWKNPAAYKGTLAVDPDGRAAFVFAAPAGAVAKATLKPARKSAAAPALVAVVSPDGRTTSLAGGATGGVPLGGTGDHLLVFGGGPAGGLVALAMKLKAPKTTKLKFTIRADDVARGAGVAAVRTIGPEGGDLSLGSGPLAGSSITVSPGAVVAPATFLLGGAPEVAGLRAGAAAGPAVFVGPEGLTFGAGTVTLRIPYDPDAFGADTAKLRVYTRGADGAVSVVAGVLVDAASHSVSFAVSHFSSYQVVREFAFQETQRLALTPPPTLIVHGRNVTVSGDVAAAGSQNYFAGFEVPVYHRSAGSFTWETNLKSPAPLDVVDFFGYSASASGDRLLVGAPRRQRTVTHTGAAYVFLRSAAGTWTQEATLLPTDDWEAFFGGDVALDGDTAFVAAKDADADGSGAVYVFDRDAVSGIWSLTQTLRETPPVGAWRFGLDVALHGDTAIVRAGQRDSPDAVLVFRRVAGSWTKAHVLASPEVRGIVRDVAIDGTTIVVGTADQSNTEYGAVQVFEDEGTTLRQVARFTTADVAQPGELGGGEFGAAVALSGDLLLVGAPNRNPGNGLAGGAHVFQRVGGRWRYALRLRGRPDDAFPQGPNDQYGGSVALDGTTAIIGAPNEPTDVIAYGAVYVVDLSGN